MAKGLYPSMEMLSEIIDLITREFCRLSGQNDRVKHTGNFLMSEIKMISEVIELLSEEVYKIHGRNIHLRRIIAEPELRQRIARELVRRDDGVYRVDIRGRSIKQLVEDGKYDSCHPDINDTNFAADAAHQADIVLKYYDDTNIEGVGQAMLAENLRPATISELLELACQYPELQRLFQIAALGSLNDDRLRRFGLYYYACLDGSDDYSSVNMHSCSRGRCGTHLAAVRK